jgi:hypothetical protein
MTILSVHIYNSDVVSLRIGCVELSPVSLCILINPFLSFITRMYLLTSVITKGIAILLFFTCLSPNCPPVSGDKLSFI